MQAEVRIRLVQQVRLNLLAEVMRARKDASEVREEWGQPATKKAGPQ